MNADPAGNNPGSRERDFDSALERVPCLATADARRLVLFGSHCLQSTPVNGVTPYSLLTAWPGLLGCLSLTTDWAEGDEVTGKDLLEALQLAHQVARKAAGEYHADVSGP